MKKIPLNSNNYALVDDEDYDLVSEYHWHCNISGKRTYCRTFIISDGDNVKRKSLLIQHLIVGKAPIGYKLHFKDGNPLNCQRNNLEFITRGFAAHKYYKKTKNNRNVDFNFRGVRCQYIASIKHNNKIVTIGFFNSATEAAKAYNLKAQELYGDRATLNVV